MSRRANPLDNAPMESFFHTLKTELVHHRTYATRDQEHLRRVTQGQLAAQAPEHHEGNDVTGILDPVQQADTLHRANGASSDRTIRARRVQLRVFADVLRCMQCSLHTGMNLRCFRL